MFSTIPRRIIQIGLILLVCLLPFESSAGLPLGGLVFNSIELPAAVLSLIWIVLLIGERRMPDLPRWLLLLGISYSTAHLAAALVAPEYGRDALKFALRQTQAVIVGACLAEQIRHFGWPFARTILLSLLASGSLSAMLGLWELGEAPFVLDGLSIFKTQLSFVVGTLRLSGTFVYANVAAMFYEALLPLAIIAGVGILAGRWRLLGVIATIVLLVAALLTYSRAALGVVIGLLLLIPLVVAWARRRPPLRLIGIVATAGLVLGGLPGLAPTIRLRLIEPEAVRWYGATYQPTPLTQLAAAEQRSIAIRLTNTGVATWQAQGARPVMLAYHWFDPRSGQAVIFDGIRTPLPYNIAPGESIDILANLQAPTVPGTYQLAWDLLLENGGGWFSQYQIDMPRMQVEVIGTPTAQQPSRPSDPAPHRTTIAPVTTDELPPPSRGLLWRAALSLWMQRPLLGIGPGVFQYVYGPVAGLSRWDTRIHTNNLYLELLVGGGVWVLFSFVLLIGQTLRKGMQYLRQHGAQSAGSGAWWGVLASMLGVVAFLLHGVLDAFIAFMTTNLLLWVLIGVVMGITTQPLAKEQV
ncbi:MAG: hypothetical protein Fur005_27400 [Roseiflexaceae bacterium]